MKKNKLTQIVAIFALFSIIISLVGTGLLVIFGAKNSANNNTEKQLTPEQIKQIQDMIKTQSGITSGTGTNNGTGTTK